MSVWRKHVLSLIIILLLLCANIVADSLVQACTLWSAAGSKVSGSGVIIAKNRDQTIAAGKLKIISATGQKYRYFAVMYGSFPSMGINEKGLALISATAPDKSEDSGTGVNSHILSSYSSVADVINNLSSFSGYHPQFFVIADKSQAARIEIAPDTETNNVMATTISDGVLAQTNHYLEQSFVHLNYDSNGNLVYGKTGSSSGDRYARITALLAGQLSEHAPPFNLGDFMTFSQDQTNGNNNSIYRTACTSNTDGECTLASFLTSIPQTGSPTVYVGLNNQYSGGTQQSCGFVTDDSFWADWTGKDSVTCDYTISGTVKSQATGEAISNAVIALTKVGATESTPAAMTDNSGNYTARIPSAGTYTVSVKKAGYADYTQSNPPFVLTDASRSAVLAVNMANSSAPGSPAAASGGGPCFIATAAYGSYFHPYVEVLRMFRDKILLTSSFGESFVAWYYRVSPPLADVIARHSALGSSVRIALFPAVGLAWLWLEEGMIAALLSLLLFGTVVFTAGRMIRRRFRT
ncbi:MAG: hypothetical protein CSYNP_02634 [Syntrophus sp. SKADARSKE-3]|nr:hypothetical protein [Syntrophus sp. SKADARSKE-3]